MSTINKTNTGNPEWHTPPEYIEAARKVMGTIDMDPASNASAQEVVQASEWYNKEDSGLDYFWMGNVWLNPPYHVSNKKQGPGIDAFAKNLLHDIEVGFIKQAIFLAQNKADTQWYRSLIEKADATCITTGRINFIDQHGKPGTGPAFGSVFFYFGDNIPGFFESFGDYGYFVNII